MKRLSNNGLEVMQFDLPEYDHVIHGFFTRRGGVSAGHWTSLNQGGTVGDEREHVIENRKRAFDFFNRPVESLFDVYQVHSTKTICTNDPRDLDSPHQKADAIFTDNPKITLFMRFADCVPIMLYDPKRNVVGIVHAGWKGTLGNIVKNAIDAIKAEYKVNPQDLVAGIGPSIGPDHYEVGEEVYQRVVKEFGSYSRELLFERNEKLYFNLWQANHHWLEMESVTRIECAEICTACHTEDWYSHRAEKGMTGRFGAMIALKGRS